MGDEIVKTPAVTNVPAVANAPAVANPPVVGEPKSKKWLYWVVGAVVVIAVGLLIWKFVL